MNEYEAQIEKARLRTSLLRDVFAGLGGLIALALLLGAMCYGCHQQFKLETAKQGRSM